MSGEVKGILFPVRYAEGVIVDASGRIIADLLDVEKPRNGQFIAEAINAGGKKSQEADLPIAIWDTTTWYESPRWATLTLSGAHDGEPIAVAVREPYIGSDGDEDGNSFPVVEWTGSIKLADRVTDLSDDLCDAYTDAICTALMAMASD